MFKAQTGLTEEEIVILDPYWNNDTIVPLRQQGRDDQLTCPVCKQPVLVRAGRKKRWHFAHKDLSNCPLKNESPNVLQARVLLYSWLKSKLGERVTIEKYFPGTDLPRPIDCYVELPNEKKIGYWILERGLRDRWPVEHALSEFGISVVWVPLIDMLREDEEDQSAVHLTPTERDIAVSSDYNQLYSHFDSALSYLNAEDKTVLTLRGLGCIHSPQKYQFDFKLETTLEQMLFFPQTGEFVHPGEHERLEELRREIEEQERRKAVEEEKRQERERERQKELAEQRKRMFSNTPSQTRNVNVDVSQPSPSLPKSPKEQKKVPESYNYLEKPYPCKICGTITVNWTSLDLSDNTCICSRECLAESHKIEKQRD